ncbi:hypothetical protein ES705_23179 [subsurface metagenome]
MINMNRLVRFRTFYDIKIPLVNLNERQHNQ